MCGEGGSGRSVDLRYIQINIGCVWEIFYVDDAAIQIGRQSDASSHAPP